MSCIKEISLLLCVICCFITKDLSVASTKDCSADLLIQDSLIIEKDSIKLIVYFGYMNQKAEWDDVIEICQKSNNDTILHQSFKFVRALNEGRVAIESNSAIPNEKIAPLSFIIVTSFSNRGNFSENYFTYSTSEKAYSFEKRINYMDYLSFDTVGVKTVFEIENKHTIDSLEMRTIFEYENELCHNGGLLENSEWIIRSN